MGCGVRVDWSAHAHVLAADAQRLEDAFKLCFDKNFRELDGEYDATED